MWIIAAPCHRGSVEVFDYIGLGIVLLAHMYKDGTILQLLHVCDEVAVFV